MARQTSMSLEELGMELNKLWSSYPSCLIIDEIGEICSGGNKEAEKILSKFLKEGDPHEQYPAYRWLLTSKSPDPETVSALKDYKQMRLMRA